MKRWRPNGSVRGMDEHVRGILKHNISLNLIKMETYLPLSKLTQLKEYSKLLNLLNSEVLKDKILNSEIRYSTQRYDIRLWVQAIVRGEDTIGGSPKPFDEHDIVRHLDFDNGTYGLRNKARTEMTTRTTQAEKEKKKNKPDDRRDHSMNLQVAPLSPNFTEL
uniref:Uncharacterized protein n=1 Tax=Solanum tuberosum TaxID=4113 RepID=M1DKS8_SOLTU